MDRMTYRIYRKYDTELFVMAHAGMPIASMAAALIHTTAQKVNLMIIPKYQTTRLIDFLDHTKENSEDEYTKKQYVIPIVTKEAQKLIASIQPGYRRQYMSMLLMHSILQDTDEVSALFKGKYRVKTQHNGEEVYEQRNYRHSVTVGASNVIDTHVDGNTIYLVIDAEHKKSWFRILSLLGRGKLDEAKEEIAHQHKKRDCGDKKKDKQNITKENSVAKDIQNKEVQEEKLKKVKENAAPKYAVADQEDAERPLEPVMNRQNGSADSQNKQRKQEVPVDRKPGKKAAESVKTSSNSDSNVQMTEEEKNLSTDFFDMFLIDD